MASDNTTAQRVRVFNVPLGNDLCDVTAQWILQTSGQDPLTVSSTILLLPNNRAIKAMTEAFVRQAAPGLLLPRMVAVGDMQLDEALGPLLDPIASEGIIWPVIGSFDRLMLLARLAQEHRPQGTFLSSAEALRLAREAELDLVEVNPKGVPPVCKIMDFGKFKFEQAKQARIAKKKQHVIHLKEVKYRPGIDDHDFETKTRHARRFLEEGNKVKVTLMFRGRQIAHPELGRQVVDRVAQELADLAKIESAPSMEGKSMTMILAPK